MLNYLKKLSIGKMVLYVSILIIGFSLLTSNIVSYWRFSSTSDDLVETTSKEINKQILMNYENYMESIIDIAHFLELEILSKTQTNDLEALNDVLETSESLDQFIVSISLFETSGSSVVSTVEPSQISNSIVQEPWFLNAMDEKNMFHFAPPTSDLIEPSSGETVIHVAKAIKYYDEGSRTDGVLTMALSMEQFEQLAKRTNLGDYGHLIFIDEYGQLVYASEGFCEDNPCESLDYGRNQILGGSHTTIDGVNMYGNVNTLNHTRWQMASFFDTNAIAQTQQTVLYTVTLIFGVSIIIAALLSWLASNRISKPIEKLKNHMNRFEEGIFLEPVKISGQQEVVMLSDTFNKMSEEIKRLVDKVYAEQRAKRKNQFIALQNQINPHFLYNTLDSILYLTENQRTNEASMMIASLSKFFRLSISTESTTVKLEEELTHVKNYLKIQKIRYRNTFEFHITCDDNLLDFEVLKLSLQPLVENAILHGIDPEEKENKIDIVINKDESFLYIGVKNSGYGISPSQISAIKDRISKDIHEPSKIGLSNIYQRLKLHFGSKADLKIDSEMDLFTKVTMIVPIKEAAK